MGERLIPLVVPGILGFVGFWGCFRGVDVYAALGEGAREGMRTVARIFPALVALLTAVSMLRASGAIQWAADGLQPILSRLGLPGELVGLMLVRPLSGSAALGVGGELMGTYGPDSYVGRVAAVMLGSTETVLYTITVYCSAAGVARTRYALPAALCAQLAGYLGAAWTVRLFFGT